MPFSFRPFNVSCRLLITHYSFSLFLGGVASMSSNRHVVSVEKVAAFVVFRWFSSF
jgi:hypothetical protein